MVRLNREDNPIPGEKPGYLPQFINTDGTPVTVTPSTPYPTTDEEVKAELTSVKTVLQGNLNINPKSITAAGQQNTNWITLPPGGEHLVNVDLNGYNFFQIYIRTETAGNLYIIDSYNGGIDNVPAGFADKAEKRNIILASNEQRTLSNKLETITPYEVLRITNISANSITLREVYVYRYRGRN